jgi:hypothetical protein
MNTWLPLLLRVRFPGLPAGCWSAAKGFDQLNEGLVWGKELLHCIRGLLFCPMLETEQKKGKKDACWLGVLPVLAYRREVNAEQIGQFPGGSSDILCDLWAC